MGSTTSRTEQPCAFCSFESDPVAATRVRVVPDTESRAEVIIEIPRCAECEKSHSTTRRIGGTFGTLGGIGLAVLVLSYATRNRGNDEAEQAAWWSIAFAMFIAGALGATVSAAIGKLVWRGLRRSRARAESSKFGLASVRVYTDRGWIIDRTV